MGFHFGDGGVPENKPKSLEDPSAMMTTFELEIVTDKLNG